MHSRQDPAGFVRHDERITLICSLLHLINFEASYASEKLKFQRNSQLFLARCLAMRPLSLRAARRHHLIPLMPLPSNRGAVGCGFRLKGVRTEVRLLPGRNSFCINLPCSYRTPKHLSQLFHSLSRKQLIISMFYAAEGGRLRAS